MARKGRVKSKDKPCLFAADGNESFTGQQYTKYSAPQPFKPQSSVASVHYLVEP